MRRVGALILAAGGSTRFGAPKQLLKFGGKSLVRRIADAAAGACCDPIVIVAGDAIDQVRDQVRGCEVIRNPHWQRGIGSSIKCGLEQFRDRVTAIVMLACDQPFVSAEIIKELIAQDAPIVASSYDDTMGIPALFDSAYFDALAGLPDQTGAKALLEQHRAAVAVVAFPDGAVDIDTPADFDGLNLRNG
ncbi:MAG: NTP transferase domain-containing protein [Chthoniobacterales bacterium]